MQPRTTRTCPGFMPHVSQHPQPRALLQQRATLCCIHKTPTASAPGHPCTQGRHRAVSSCPLWGPRAVWGRIWGWVCWMALTWHKQGTLGCGSLHGQGLLQLLAQTEWHRRERDQSSSTRWARKRGRSCPSRDGDHSLTRRCPFSHGVLPATTSGSSPAGSGCQMLLLQG